MSFRTNQCCLLLALVFWVERSKRGKTQKGWVRALDWGTKGERINRHVPLFSSQTRRLLALTRSEQVDQSLAAWQLLTPLLVGPMEIHVFQKAKVHKSNQIARKKAGPTPSQEFLKDGSMVRTQLLLRPAAWPLVEKHLRLFAHRCVLKYENQNVSLVSHGFPSNPIKKDSTLTCLA